MSQEEGAMQAGLSKAQEAERQKMEKEMRKRAAMELADYKKRLRESNEVKSLQVEELKLNIDFYTYKKQWMEVQPEMEALEARERAMIAEEKEKQHKELEAKQKEAEKKRIEAEKKKPEIIVPKTGKPRE